MRWNNGDDSHPTPSQKGSRRLSPGGKRREDATVNSPLSKEAQSAWAAVMILVKAGGKGSAARAGRVKVRRAAKQRLASKVTHSQAGNPEGRRASRDAFPSRAWERQGWGEGRSGASRDAFPRGRGEAELRGTHSQAELGNDRVRGAKRRFAGRIPKRRLGTTKQSFGDAFPSRGGTKRRFAGRIPKRRLGTTGRGFHWRIPSKGWTRTGSPLATLARDSSNTMKQLARVMEDKMPEP